ncbi:MAG: patatin-like phospholipase family protein [Myxococcales bacterium]|nr:patatin-like phospholipase family protein [Myxococcales bacterium]
MSQAIVLSGGGPVGIAWQTGLAVGLAECGVELAGAELVVGTSAGSAVGAQLALGRDLGEAMARFEPAPVRSPEKPEAKRERGAGSGRWGAGGGGGPMAELFGLMGKAMAGDGDPQAARAALGRLALEARTVAEEGFKKAFAYLGGESWPAAFRCTAVDVESGEFKVWDRAAAVTLVDAVASSCAVPGIFPPITIGGRRYMDGGMRSGTNADLAVGYGRVLVVSLLGVPGAGAAEGASPFARLQSGAERERAALVESGAEVLYLAPDAEAAAVIGMELMNARRSHAAAQAGLRQGRAEAARLRDFWR